MNTLPFQSISHAAADDDEMKVLRMYFNEDKLVVSATRTLKRLSQVPENMEIITSKDIERMNAHTLAEVLERVNGMFVSFYGHDFGSDGSLSLQGSSDKHVLLLLDGIIWNNINEGNVITNTVPVRIIERIEIIKGPASSAWGSSLGGVINIVTKGTGEGSVTGATLNASSGERGTSDLSAGVSVNTGSVRYYLHAGKQESDGLWNDRWFDNDILYAKFNVPVSSDTELMFTAGYTEPHISDGDLVLSDLRAYSITRNFFMTSSISTEIANNLTFDSSVYYMKHRFYQDIDELAVLYAGTPGARYKDTLTNEKSSGFSGKFVLVHDNHTALLGADYRYGNVEQVVDAGQYLISFRGAPATTEVSSSITKWALFANDTISLGRLSVTPGIRYDNSSAAGSFVSPSIGATYRATRNTILRASIAKGFNEPSLAATTSGGLFTDPNPDLTHEKIWSYQAGLELWAVEYLKLRFNVFHHYISDFLKKVAVPGSSNSMYHNMDKSKRDGFEIGLETAPFHDVSIKTGYAFVHTRTYSTTATSRDTYAYNIALSYDDRKSLYAELDGRYVWWDYAAGSSAKYDTFICDLNISKKLHPSEKISSQLFLAVHNIFNGSYYLTTEKKNPSRWVEAGLRVTF